MCKFKGNVAMNYKKNRFFIFFILCLGLLEAPMIRAVDEFEPIETQDTEKSKSTIQKLKDSWNNWRKSRRTESPQKEPYVNPFLKVPETDDEEDKNDDKQHLSFSHGQEPEQPVVTMAAVPTAPSDQNSDNDWDIVSSKDLTTKNEPNSSQDFMQNIRDNLRNFKDNRFYSSPKPEQTQLSEEELNRLDALTEKIRNMSPEQIKTLSPQDIQDLSIDIGNLTPEQIANLTREQIQKMTMDQIAIFNRDQIQKFKFSDLTVEQIKQLVSTRSTKLLHNLTDDQLTQLTPQQIEACMNAVPDTFSKEQLDSLQQQLILKGGSKVKSFLSKFSAKNFFNIFKSDKKVLQEYLQDDKTRENRTKQQFLKDAINKLSVTERADLFTDIVRNDAKELNNKTIPEYTNLFKGLIPKNELLIPTFSPSKDFQFIIFDMQDYNPSLTIAENATRMTQNQGFDSQEEDFTDQSKNIADDIRDYLEENPSPENLKALLVDNADTTRKLNFDDEKTSIENIISKPGMKDVFNKLTAQDLTDITNAELRLKEKNMNLGGWGAKVSDAETRRIFMKNAELYQSLAQDTLVIPIEEAAKNNRESFQFEKINISSIQDKNWADLFKDTNNQAQKVLNQAKIETIATDLKADQDLKLSIENIAKILKDYTKSIFPDELFSVPDLQSKDARQ